MWENRFETVLYNLSNNFVYDITQTYRPKFFKGIFSLTLWNKSEKHRIQIWKDIEGNPIILHNFPYFKFDQAQEVME